jgi:hypothetical protein
MDLLWELGGWVVGLGFDLPFRSSAELGGVRSSGFLCDAVYELQTLRFRDILYQQPNTRTQYSQFVGEVLGQAGFQQQSSAVPYLVERKSRCFPLWKK